MERSEGHHLVESVKPAEATAFIRGAVGSESGDWIELGAGTGTFTRALARILGESGSIVAVDRDAEAVKALERLARSPRSQARIEAVVGDFADLGAIPALRQRAFDGVLIANALHYSAQPEQVLASTARRVREGGRVVIVEYERRAANPWVPYPLPTNRLQTLAEQVGLPAFRVVARRPSAYQREMYCAVSFVAAGVE